MSELNANKIISGTIPKYRQLLEILRNQIISGEFQPGAQLPTEDVLIERYGISRGTVRKGIDQLEAEKLIRKEHGVGSFVLTEHPNAVPFYFSDESLVQRFGKDRISFDDLTKEIIPASFDIAERLRITPGEPVIHIARRQLLDDEVVCYSVRYIPEVLCPSLMNMDLNDQPLHKVLVFISEIPLLHADMQIEARIVNEEEARLLRAEEKISVIAITRMTYTAPNRPAVWYQALFKNQVIFDIRVGG